MTETPSTTNPLSQTDAEYNVPAICGEIRGILAAMDCEGRPRLVDVPDPVRAARYHGRQGALAVLAWRGQQYLWAACDTSVDRLLGVPSLSGIDPEGDCASEEEAVTAVAEARRAWAVALKDDCWARPEPQARELLAIVDILIGWGWLPRPIVDRPTGEPSAHQST